MFLAVFFTADWAIWHRLFKGKEYLEIVVLTFQIRNAEEDEEDTYHYYKPENSSLEEFPCSVAEVPKVAPPEWRIPCDYYRDYYED